MIWSVSSHEWCRRWGIARIKSEVRKRFPYRFVTEHVEIWSDSNRSQTRLKEIGSFVDAVVTELWQFFCGHLPCNHLPPLLLLLPNRRDRYQQLVKDCFDNLSHYRSTDAFTSYKPLSCSVVQVECDRLWVYHQIAHELTHQFFRFMRMFKNRGDAHSLAGMLPIWLNEGLAEFCGDFMYKPGTALDPHRRAQVKFGVQIWPRLPLKDATGLGDLVSWDNYDSNTAYKFHRSNSFVAYLSREQPELFVRIRRWIVGYAPIPWFMLRLMLFDIHRHRDKWKDYAPKWCTHVSIEWKIDAALVDSQMPSGALGMRQVHQAKSLKLFFI